MEIDDPKKRIQKSNDENREVSRRSVNEIPVQEGDGGYNTNLRGKGWKTIGYSAK